MATGDSMRFIRSRRSSEFAIILSVDATDPNHTQLFADFFVESEFKYVGSTGDVYLLFSVE